MCQNNCNIIEAENKEERKRNSRLSYEERIEIESMLRRRKKMKVTEIAKELGVEREEVAFSFDAIQDPVSLQEPVYNDGSESIFIMDQVKDTKNSDESWADNMTIEEALKRLGEKEKKIIIKRYFDGRTQMEVAEEIGISQAQVSRLEKNALDYIKRYYK